MRKPPPPDLISADERAAFVAQAMLRTQQQVIQLRAQQVLNAETDDDPVAGLEPKGPGAYIPTYKERRESLEAGIKRLWDDNADVQDRITALNEQRHAAQAPIEGSQSTAGG